MPDDLAAITKHIDSLYTFDHRGRITGSNQFCGGEVPRFHIARSAAGNVWRFREDLDDKIVEAISVLATSEPVLANPETPCLAEPQFLELLANHTEIESVWRGPAYVGGKGLVQADREGVLHIREQNAKCLEAHMDDWLVDVPHRRPFVASIVDGEAVAVCASVRITDYAHQAGVETVTAFRRQGHAARVVTAWAQAVMAIGATPIYSTSWDNQASQALAKLTGFQFIGSDLHIR